MKTLIFAFVCASLAAPRAGALELAACRLKGIEREVKCGTLEVPENPDAPDGRRIPIRFAVVPALAKNKAPDPLFVFAGGPGQSALKAAGTIQPVFAQLNARRDIVYVDQRGTGASNGLFCATPPSTAPLAEQLDHSAAALRVEQCVRRIGSEGRADLRQYATWIAVRDVDAVRAALGDAQINLWGGSYGTRAALEYLRQFPQRVRSAVLDGVAPPDMALPASLSVDADAMLRDLAQRCAADAGCQSRYPDFAGKVDQLLARADRTAPPAPALHPITGARELVTVDHRVLAAALRVPLYAPQLSALLPHAVAAAARGDYSPLLALAGAPGSDVADHFAEAMHFAVVCAEDMPRMDAAARAAARATRFGLAFAQIYDEVCRRVDVRAVPAAFYGIASADVPVLILSGGADPATPPRHGEAVAKRLKRALHLVAPHLGHGVSAQGCAPELITKFVRQAGFGGIDGACLEKLPAPPFFQMPTGQPR
jgi:pimeloyl-ACP methyl ester carboxylesterase